MEISSYGTAFLCYPWHKNICDIIICTTCIYLLNKVKSNQIKSVLALVPTAISKISCSLVKSNNINVLCMFC